MDEIIKELISKADRGDEESQKALMQLGDDASKTGNDKQASYYYKMAAIAYRITAARKNSLYDEAQAECKWLHEELKLYQEWIDKYTKPVAPRMNKLSNICVKKKCSNLISQLITSMTRGDYKTENMEKYSSMLYSLEEKLTKHGIIFSSPGGTINVHFLNMVWKEKRFAQLQEHVEIRVLLDQIVDEVISKLDDPIFLSQLPPDCWGPISASTPDFPKKIPANKT